MTEGTRREVNTILRHGRQILNFSVAASSLGCPIYRVSCGRPHFQSTVNWQNTNCLTPGCTPSRINPRNGKSPNFPSWQGTYMRVDLPAIIPWWSTVRHPHRKGRRRARAVRNSSPFNSNRSLFKHMQHRTFIIRHLRILAEDRLLFSYTCRKEGGGEERVVHTSSRTIHESRVTTTRHDSLSVGNCSSTSASHSACSVGRWKRRPARSYQ